MGHTQPAGQAHEMPDPVEMINRRVDGLEEAIAQGLGRIEDLLRQQITDLKSEQIKDLKDNYMRLADDQRRLWEAVRELEKARNIQQGSHHVMSAIWGLLSAALGGSVVAFVGWLTAKGH